MLNKNSPFSQCVEIANNLNFDLDLLLEHSVISKKTHIELYEKVSENIVICLSNAVAPSFNNTKNAEIEVAGLSNTTEETVIDTTV